MSTERPFARRAFFDDEGLVGVRWWQEGLAAQADPVSRRSALRKIAGLLAGVGAAGVLLAWCSSDDHDDLGGGHGGDPDIQRDALELQKEQGWDVGTDHAGLSALAAAVPFAAGGEAYRPTLPQLADFLAPSSTRLRPYFVPTLFQVLAAPSAENLRRSLVPIHDSAMDEAFGRGAALADLFSGPETPPGTAVLLDLPGPQAVAAAAGMAPHFEPVFLFDNWPHPKGVVPSHLVLAAAAYELPHLRAAAAVRPADSPPVFVGDDSRLAPYSDASDRFDNRYLLRLPGPASLEALGIKRLLIVRPKSGDVELDDLNDDVVALARAGLDVKLVALDDFQAPADGDAGVGTAATTPTLVKPSALEGPPPRRYYWGGHPATHLYFWPTYGYPRTISRPLPTPSLPRVGSGASYRPAPRPTMFSSHTVGGVGGVGKIRPTGFGRVSVSSGGGSGRSGSWGRTTSSSGG